MSELAMFRPPLHRGMRVLDRSLFTKEVCLAAARVFDIRATARIATQLTKANSVLQRRLLRPTQDDPAADGKARKCILLQPDIRHDDQSTWCDTIKTLVTSGDIRLFPYPLTLNYDHWTSPEILSAVIPEELHSELPAGFALVGHIAHVNLREAYMPYKYLIGQVLMDKNPPVRTVVNKMEPLDGENEFRVLPLELLAGEPEYETVCHEVGYKYHFDFSKVFWNTRLSTEHQRLCSKFQAGEAVCDVMAGVGPFAIPAASRECWVWANDLNPHCFESLQASIKLNKSGDLIRPFCEDGHTFIKTSGERLLREHRTLTDVPRKDLTRSALRKLDRKDRTRVLREPSTFSHYVMNLPGTATEFLPDFSGVYVGHEDLFEPHTTVKLPMIHVYCFAPKPEPGDAADAAGRELVCQLVSDKIGFRIDRHDPDLEVFSVRDVAPNKRQMCASFRLPPEVAFKPA